MARKTIRIFGLGWLLVGWLVCIDTTEAWAQRKKNRQREPSERDMRDAEGYFIDGMKFFVLGNYDRALPAFQKALFIAPENAAIHFQLATLFAKTQDLERALGHARQALELDEQNPYYYLLLAQLHEQLNASAEAIKVYQRLVRRFPDNKEFFFPLADALLQHGKSDEAIRTYDQIQESYGINEEIIRRKQQIYLRQNKLDKALQEGRKLIDYFPEESGYVISQVEMLIANDRIDETETLLEMLLSREPNHSKGRLLMAELYHRRGDEARHREQLKVVFADPEVEIDHKIAVLMGYLPRLEDAQAQQTALTLAEATRQAHPKDPKAFAISGDLLALAGQRPAAREQYLRSAALDGSHFEVWQQIVAIDFEQQQFDSLAVHTEAALELFPNQAILWLYNGVGYYFTKDHRRAARAFETGRKLVAGNDQLLLQFHTQLGDTYHELQEHAKSDAAYEAALGIDPHNATTLNNYSYYLSLRREKLDKARKMGEQLIAENPANPTFLDTYGWILYTLEEYEKARPYLERAAADSESGIVIEHYGDVLYRLGQYDAAVEQWRRARAVGGELTNYIDRKIADRKLYE